MSWLYIIKAKRKGQFVSKKHKKFAKKCIESIDGLKVVDWKISNKGAHLVAKCEYTGDDLPPGKKVIKINNTINIRKFGMNNRTCSGLKARCRKELAKREVFIGDW